MAIRVLVIGQHDPVQDIFEAAAARVGPNTDTFMMLRCPAPDLLFDTVLRAVRALNEPISVLDLYDHGGNGRLHMGEPREALLFSADGASAIAGQALAGKLADLLTHDAHVHLLGCETALEEPGKRMLLTLQRAFGKSIVVHGTLQAVGPSDFGVGGFQMLREGHVLFSSTEAAELTGAQVALTYDDRGHELHLWRRRIG